MGRPRWWIGVLGVGFASLLVSGAAEERSRPGSRQDELLTVRILYEASNHVELEVRYSYSGSHGRVAYVAPELLSSDGRSHPANGGTTPGAMVPGRGTAWTRLYFDSPPFGARPSGTNLIVVRAYAGDVQRTRLAERRLRWPIADRPAHDRPPRLLTAVSAGAVEETRDGRRPVEWASANRGTWATAHAFFSRGGSPPQVCRFLVFEDLSERNQIALVATRNGLAAGEERTFLPLPARDLGFAMYDATSSVHFCAPHSRGQWEEVVLLNGKAVGRLRYTVDMSTQG